MTTTNQTPKTTAKLQAKGYERFYADPTTPFVDVLMNSYETGDGWALSLEVGKEGDTVTSPTFKVDKTLSNDSQANLWIGLLEWFESADVCNEELARLKSLETSCQKTALPAQKVAGEVFDWFINDVGVAVGEALKNGEMTAEHPFVTINIVDYGKHAAINAFTDNQHASKMNAQETLSFLQEHPNAVVYPSKGCTGVENTVLYKGYVSDKQKLSRYENHSVVIDYNPIKHANWLKALKEQPSNLWGKEGAHSYSGFDIAPVGDYIPKITEY